MDREAQSIVEGMHQRARHILKHYRDRLETLAQYLLEHEVIEQPTLASLIGDLRSDKQPEFIDS